MDDLGETMYVGVVESDPFHGAYLNDLLAALAPHATVALYPTVGDALHAVAARCGTGTSAANLLLVDAETLSAELAIIAEPLRLLRALAPLRVTALVADPHEAEVSSAIAAAADEVLSKPCDPAELGALLGNAAGVAV